MTFGADYSGALKLVLWVHIVAGTIALAIFLVPMTTLKGGRVHTKSGWIYSAAMGALALAAIALTPWRMFFDGKRSEASQSFALFLTFIAILSTTSLWFGVRATQTKRRTERDLRPINTALPVVLLVAAITTMIAGVQYDSPLLTYFPILGLLTSADYLNYWRRPPVSRWSYWYAHMNGMFTACIGTVTAFLVTAVPRMTDAAWTKSLLLWFAPTIVGVPVLQIWTRFYKAKFE